MRTVTATDTRLLATVADLVAAVTDLRGEPLSFEALHELTIRLDGPTRRHVFDRLPPRHSDACWQNLNDRAQAR